ncbi:MAG: alpha/beta hydrolase [Pseudomonadota bacterium]
MTHLPRSKRLARLLTVPAIGTALAGTVSTPMAAPVREKSITAEQEAEWEAAWEAAEEHQRLLEKARDVNEGDLVFLAREPAPDAPRMEKRLDLDENSLRDGWAEMTQCHYHLDAVPAAQVVYASDRTRAIEVTRMENIGEAVAEKASVQLRDVGPDATLCVRAEVLALVPAPEGDGYWVDNGPFMRRFLDGYYPMQVRLEVHWPPGVLHFERAEPPAQPGHKVKSEADRVTVTAHFEGRLRSRLHFERAD